jgi:hypothetical protein
LDRRKEQLKQLRDLSTTLDTRFEGPFGFRFGLDGLIGLIPIVGDFITSAISVYIIIQAAAMGVAPATLVRMALNVGIENLFDMIPVVGNFFDFYWKANQKNMILLESHLRDPARETIKSRMIVALVFFSLLIILILSGYVTYRVAEALFEWFMSLRAQ